MRVDGVKRSWKGKGKLVELGGEHLEENGAETRFVLAAVRALLTLVTH
jgi:hypothetical protein